MYELANERMIERMDADMNDYNYGSYRKETERQLHGRDKKRGAWRDEWTEKVTEKDGEGERDSYTDGHSE